MAKRNLDLHGNAPDKADVALMLIDVINRKAARSGFNRAESTLWEMPSGCLDGEAGR